MGCSDCSAFELIVTGLFTPCLYIGGNGSYKLIAAPRPRRRYILMCIHMILFFDRCFR
jgi:hypothetical protein